MAAELTASGGAERPVESKADLVAYLAAGEKAPGAFRIGTEHEKFVYRRADLRPLAYEGGRGIRWLLERFADRFGWQIKREGGLPVALERERASITLEPGGQFELSGAPLATLHDTCREANRHLAEVKAITEPAGLGVLGIGFNPKWRLADIPRMPKPRYDIMTRYMPTRGTLGVDMMYRSATIQVNLDFAAEADMVKKFRVGIALQPLATALFANSPFSDGVPNGYLSYRSHCWTDTDSDRAGMLPFVFDEGFGYERYVDYMLDVPMYFVQRGDRMIDLSGRSFRDFMGGRLPELPGELPTVDDWADHLTTAFPEVRLKRFLEMRGADGGPWNMICALPALWVGLLYDAATLDATWDLCRDWSIEEIARMRADVPRLGLEAPFRDRTVGDLAVEVLALAEAGLGARAHADVDGRDERQHLAPLQDIVDRRETPAEQKLRLVRDEWNGSVDPIFTRFAY
ncbi:MAG: glutamate--cysteine ligase [Alphaproteobacteria bacterium]|jgi:glutamate--cysteine ligase|nr:glutamate--cysteine ligase [Alphaproteobacteria bacterium]